MAVLTRRAAALALLVTCVAAGPPDKHQALAAFEKVAARLGSEVRSMKARMGAQMSKAMKPAKAALAQGGPAPPAGRRLSTGPQCDWSGTSCSPDATFMASIYSNASAELLTLRANIQACEGHLTELNCLQASTPKCVWEFNHGKCTFDPNDEHIGALVMSTTDCGWLGAQFAASTQCQLAATQAECQACTDCMWWVASGPCFIDSDMCAHSPNYPSDYGNDQSCTIAVNAEHASPLDIVAFNTESGYDYLFVDGVAYHGSSGPQGVTPSGSVTWSSEFMVTKSGWKICPEGPGPNTTAAPKAGMCSFVMDYRPDGGVGASCSWRGECEVNPDTNPYESLCPPGFDPDSAWNDCYTASSGELEQAAVCLSEMCPFLGALVAASIECSGQPAEICTSKEQCMLNELGNCQEDIDSLLFQTLPAGCPLRDMEAWSSELACEGREMSQCTGQCEWMKDHECDFNSVSENAWCEPGLAAKLELFAQAGNVDAQTLLRAELVSQNCLAQQTPSDCVNAVFQTTPTATTTSAIKLKLKLKVKGKHKMRALLKVKIVNGLVEAKAKVKAASRRRR